MISLIYVESLKEKKVNRLEPERRTAVGTRGEVSSKVKII